MPALFISYRRTDSPDPVKLIHERLKKRLPRWEIFYDHESIPLGDQFPERLRAKVASATVVLVIIGPKWLKILQERKSAPVDHVRAEVRLALELTMSVVPVLVGHAAMPTDAELAEFIGMQPLLQRNGRPVCPDPDFNGDLETIIARVKQFDSDEAVGATLADKYTLSRNEVLYRATASSFHSSLSFALFHYCFVETRWKIEISIAWRRLPGVHSPYRKALLTTSLPLLRKAKSGIFDEIAVGQPSAFLLRKSLFESENCFSYARSLP